MPPQAMPTTAPKKKAAPAKAGAVQKAAKPVKKSNFIPNLLKGKLIVHPDFFEPHERPVNWPSGK